MVQLAIDYPWVPFVVIGIILYRVYRFRPKPGYSEEYDPNEDPVFNFKFKKLNSLNNVRHNFTVLLIYCSALFILIFPILMLFHFMP